MLNPPSLFAKVFSIVFLSHHCGKGNARGATLSGSIDCSELNWDRGLVTVVPVSFAGVDSLDETRFCFLLCRPLHFKTCCCSAPTPISTSPPSATAGITSTMFPLPINAKKEMRGGDTLSDLIDCSELNWDCGLVTVVPVSYTGVDSLNETRFCFSLFRPSHFETCCCSVPPPISN